MHNRNQFCSLTTEKSEQTKRVNNRGERAENICFDYEI